MRWWLAAVATLGLAATGLITATEAHAATGCQASYSVTNQWPGGFGANVNITNLGGPITNGWRLVWSFGAGQTITQLWSGSYTQSGSQVTVTNAAWNGTVATSASTNFGFNGSWTGSNPVPTSFSLNGVTCTGGVTTPPTTLFPTPPSPSPTPTSPSPSPTSGGGTLPSSFGWSSSGVLMSPKSDARHSIIAVKDPSVVRFNGVSTSSLSQFPSGFGSGANTVIAASAANRNDMFEADNVYKVDGSNTSLMVVEAIGSNGRRLFHSWTSSSLTGSWTPLAATQTNPFLGASDVTFPTGTNAWTQDFSSGEAIRSNYDQTVTLSPCHLQYLYQGMDPSSNQSYNLLPWRLGLATQTNSSC